MNKLGEQIKFTEPKTNQPPKGFSDAGWAAIQEAVHHRVNIGDRVFPGTAIVRAGHESLQVPTNGQLFRSLLETS